MGSKIPLAQEYYMEGSEPSDDVMFNDTCPSDYGGQLESRNIEKIQIFLWS